jgi:tRNA threonylcarbamoyl adenosine modification protein YjeE
MPSVTTRSPTETEAAAARLAQSLRGGECIALRGELGAGKTRFVRGLVRGLGGDARAVSSPTFVLLNVYDSPPIRLAIYHFDAYRVAGSDDFESIGFPELLTQGGVVVVEWPQRVESLLPRGTIRVQIEPLGPSTRRIEISSPAGPSVS